MPWTKLFFSLFIYCSYHLASAQQIANLRIEQAGAKVLIHYSIENGNPGDHYNVKVYSSHDRFRQPLSVVRGDVGENIAFGGEKLIEWYAQEEIGAFTGELSVEIRLFESRNAFYVQSPIPRSSFKRGKELPINWSGGSSEGNVQIDLFRDGNRLLTINNSAANTGNYQWAIPVKQSKGNGYQVRIRSNLNENVQAFSGHFYIRPKTGLVLKIVPAAIVAGVVTYLLINPPGEQDLPSPPNPN